MNEILQITSNSIFEQASAKVLFANKTQAADPAATDDKLQKPFKFNCDMAGHRQAEEPPTKH